MRVQTIISVKIVGFQNAVVDRSHHRARNALGPAVKLRLRQVELSVHDISRCI